MNTHSIVVDGAVYEELVTEKSLLAEEYDVPEERITFAHAARSMIYGMDNGTLQDQLEDL